MKKFTDARGNEWNVEINVGSMRRVKAGCNVDLGAIFNSDLFNRLQLEWLVVADVLWHLCAPQAKSKNITQEEFEDGLRGDALMHGRKAVLEELVNFTPDPDSRETLRLAVEAIGKVSVSAQKKVRDDIARRAGSLPNSSGDQSGDAPE